MRKNWDAQGCQGIKSNDPDQRFVDETEHRNEVDIFRLADELGNDSNVIDHSLGVGESHRTVQKVEGARLSRVIEGWKRTQNDIRSDRT